MNTLAIDRSAPRSTTRAARDWPLGTLLMAEALLSFAPLAVLGSAIGWPASLGKPAAEQLSAIAAAPDAVALGYGLYLLYSILVVPLMTGLAARVFGGLNSPLATAVVVFGALSGLARSIGILRWLTVMPVLAAAHAGADPVVRSQIQLVFDALTAYGGGIGELLGVSLFMALALALLCLGGWLRGGMPAWLAWPGVASAALLGAMLLPALRVPLHVPVAVAVTGLTLWMLVAAAWCLRRR
jgi:hypothetical protein